MFDEPDGATPLAREEIEGLRFKHIKQRSELNELEQANVVQGLMWLQRRRSRNILNDSFVRRLHQRLFGDVWDWAGVYRQTEKNIGIDPVGIPVAIRELLEDASYWAEHGTYSALESAGRFHHRMVQIHPFTNGNGRHARIAADIYLKDYFDHPPIAWAEASELEVSSERRTAYIAALRAADAREFNLLMNFIGAR